MDENESAGIREEEDVVPILDKGAKDKKQNGEGSVTPHRGGRWRARVTPIGRKKRVSLGVFDTKEEAERQVEICLFKMRRGFVASDENNTLRTFAPYYLRVQKLKKRKTVKRAEQRFMMWITQATFIDFKLEDIKKRDIEDFIVWLNKQVSERTGKLLAHETKKIILSILRGIFDRAATPEFRLIEKNPAEDVTIEVMESSKRGKLETEHFLTKAEIDRLLGANKDDPEIWIIMFAIGTCMRLGELINLPLANVHIDGPNPHVLVEWGDHGTVDDRTKSGNTVKIPLFGLGLEAARRWLEAMPGWLYPSARGSNVKVKNAHGLMFPGRFGKRRTKPPSLWYLKDLTHYRKTDPKVEHKLALYNAGLSQKFRWHDLRHTGASALLSGYWGRRFSLQEVSTILNHAELKTTQRYAKFTLSATEETAREAEIAYQRMRAQEELAKAPQQVATKAPGMSRQVAGRNGGLVTVGHSEQTIANDSEGIGGHLGTFLKPRSVVRLPPGAPNDSERLGSKVEEDSMANVTNRDQREVALRLLQYVRSHDEEGILKMAGELSRAVLELPIVHLALKVRDGGPFAVSAAVKLAEMLVPKATESPDSVTRIKIQ